ncbi:MAG: dioxygenase [Verrucomicrobia bacterium]|nr:dioxygenase [Verrucomicrobiota bacterium]
MKSTNRKAAKTAAPRKPAAAKTSARKPSGRIVKRFSAPGVQYAVIEMGKVTRLALMITPTGRGPVHLQLGEALRSLRTVLEKQAEKMNVTVQTVFLKDLNDQTLCEQILAARYVDEPPVTTFVHQPPCSGAALAIEVWATGGKTVYVERPAPNVLQVSMGNITWTHCGGITPRNTTGSVYAQSLDAFQQMKQKLKKAGVEMDHLIRTWLYLGNITGPEGDLERYMELNRARTDFYEGVKFGRGHVMAGVRQAVYPASTGIGMCGSGITMSATAIDTDRKDVFILPLENPQQTPVYEYEAVYSPKSPKFVRAMAEAIGDYVVIWISGTASIVNSKTLHTGNPGKQADQTLTNIELLLSQKNLARHGAPGAGATLRDLAKLRVYVKRPQDYEIIRKVCEKRCGKDIPIIYVVADVCRSDLLVEMEGLAFAKRIR